METKTCECEYLFIINDNNKKQCLPSDIKNCHEIKDELISNYKIRKYNVVVIT